MMHVIAILSALCILIGCSPTEGPAPERGGSGGEAVLIATVAELTDEYAVVQPVEEGTEYGQYQTPEALESYDRVKFYFEPMGYHGEQGIKVGDTVSLIYRTDKDVESGDPPVIFAVAWRQYSPSEE